MIVSYVILALITGSMIYSIIKTIRNKKYADLLVWLCTIPFFVFFISAFVFGGTPFNDAANSYELYEQGHYYLVNHGHYTKVSYNIFLYMQIIEIIGLISFGIGIILALIMIKKTNDNKKSTHETY